jgi:hypothetical protein
MRAVTIEHNLEAYELEEVLEKALKGVRAASQRIREFDDPFMESRAEKMNRVFKHQTERMNERIEKVLTGE